ncbi:HAD family hydrolase [Plebeiibacterium sediminum]|uniref:HAD-IA family hydrolase n=1 Tax=Plebeiibacterium sediminum TaxID=2992112 RepID=A0AAE3M245_9BACT|nr:HAD-IA family hydrolase [Plebeiobacterium sediminum]MCW3785723.1 HAD-IA family hydrolase [Plebeiobacterium sediminum]
MSSSIIPSNLKCVIFDMDGVLYDSMKNHESTWQGCFKPEGIDFPAYEAYMHEGRTGHDTIGYAFKEYLNKEATPEDKERVYNEKVRLMGLAPKAEKMPMMYDLIQFLKERGLEIWVVTGSKQPTLLDKLNNDFGINPQQIISAKNVTNGKPHPEPYLKAVAGSGFTAEECMVVENAPLGVRSAKAAGITTIAVNTGVLDDEILANEGADIILPNTTELFTYITNLL